MAKDKTGKFHPGKGKPSGINKEEGLGIQSTEPEKMDEYMEISDKYTIGEDELAPNVHLRHPNRNTSKGEDTYKAKENKPESDKTTTEVLSEDRVVVTPEELPGTLTKEAFAELASYKAETCVSMFFDTHQSGVAVNEHYDPIAFKNALQSLSVSLKSKGIQQTAIDRLLEPAYELLCDDKFWRNLLPGLGIFIADNFFRYIKMRVVPTEESLIDSSFNVTQLIPLMINKEYFYLLVISKKQAKFFRADAFGMQYIPVEELPNGVDDVVHFEEKDDEKLFRTGGRGGTGSANFHGIGSGKPDEKTHISIYLEEVDDTLWKHTLNKENVPLLLAGVEYLIPLYKRVTDYKNIWEEALTGSHEHEDTQTLYKQARQIMEPYFKQRLNKALENYGNKSATALTSPIAADVIPAAYFGKISHLFVSKGEHIWGTFDDMANELKLHDSSAQNGEDLIDNAVEKTIITGGEVFLLDKEQMPANAQIAAIMRY